MPVTNGQIRLDASGNVSKEHFFAVSNCEYPILEFLQRKPSDAIRRVIHPRFASRELYAEVCVADRDEKLFECNNKSIGAHSRQLFFKDIGGDIFGGPHVNEFIVERSDGHLVIGRDFAKRIRSTRLLGYDIQDFDVQENQSCVKNPQLKVLQAVGRNCERPMRVEGDNACPFCGGPPVLCTACGMLRHHCPDCGKETCVTPVRREGLSDKRLILQMVDNGERVLEGRHWNGEDFVASHWHTYFSRRAFEWMEMVHAGPLIAIPAPFCLDGMSRKQRERLKVVSDISTVDKK